MWPHFPKWYFLSFTDIYITEESTQFSLKWCKKYQQQVTGLVTVTTWSHKPPQHLMLRNWHTNVFIIVLSKTLVHILVTVTKTFVHKKHNVWCKRNWAIRFCWTPQIFKKLEAPFENMPQWESGLVSIWLILKGRVTSNDSFDFVG